MKLLEVTRVSPAISAAELTHPLSFLDLFLFKLPPVGRLFFYSIPGLDRIRFIDSVLPKLKDSLALTLLHYLPLAGNILWPPSSAKPLLCYRPGDAVSLSVSESESDFHHLSGNLVRDTAEFRQLTAELPVSHDQASIFSLNITLFPTAGFCNGLTAHHAILDAKSVTMVMRSWAHICKNLVNGSAEPTLPPELSPAFDRTAIEENNRGLGLDLTNLSHWTALTETLSKGNPRSLLLMKERKTETDDSVLVTFELTPANIETLRNRVMKTEHSVSVSGSTRLSTFVLSTAYVSVQKLKSTALAKPSGDGEENRAVLVVIPVDYRARLKTPAPANYIGNCVLGHRIEMGARELNDGDGFARLAVKLSEAIRELGKGVDLGSRLPDLMTFFSNRRVIGISGSNRFGVYTADFGWGRPEKVAVQLVNRYEAVSMAESRDGSGGVEMGVAVKNLELPYFQALLADGFNSP